MDASRYFDAMHNAMSTQHVGAQLLLTVRLQDTCGNDAYLEVKQLPGEQSALVCYSTMGRRCLNFQLFRKGWQLCHNADGQLTGRFPSSADSLLSQTDFRAYCREDRLDAARTQRLIEELGQRAGTNYVGSIPQNARTGAQITVESHLGHGARWSYWNQCGRSKNSAVLLPRPCPRTSTSPCWRSTAAPTPEWVTAWPC